MKTVIILPTYNERENVKKIIPLIFESVPEIFVLVADDNSPDGTAEEVRNLENKFPRVSLLLRDKKEGLGRAYLHAFSHVLEDKDVERVIMMDADLSHSPSYLPEMLKLARTNDVVTGSRYIKGGGTVGWELWRRSLSFWGNIYSRTITGLPVHDCTAGFNIINASILRRVDLSDMDMSGYAFIMELKFNLFKAGATFAEFPIIFKNRAQGESKISSHVISEGIIAPWKMRLRIINKSVI